MSNFPVKATLIALTQPTINVPASDAEGLIAYCARVSSDKPKEERAEGYKGLLNYCMRNKHWSIFEMANAVVEVQAPRDISRQLLRHRSLSFQEFSQRYSDKIEFCERDFRAQDYKNRQNSLDTLSEETIEDFVYASADVGNIAWAVYTEMISAGVAKECARVVLPEGLTMSTLYVNGTIRSWLHYLDVRDDEGVTQLEHVMLAREIRKALEPALPTILGTK